MAFRAEERQRTWADILKTRAISADRCTHLIQLCRNPIQGKLSMSSWKSVLLSTGNLYQFQKLQRNVSSGKPDRTVRTVSGIELLKCTERNSHKVRLTVQKCYTNSVQRTGSFTATYNHGSSHLVFLAPWYNINLTCPRKQHQSFLSILPSNCRHSTPWRSLRDSFGHSYYFHMQTGQKFDDCTHIIMLIANTWTTNTKINIVPSMPN